VAFTVDTYERLCRKVQRTNASLADHIVGDLQGAAKPCRSWGVQGAIQLTYLSPKLHLAAESGGYSWPLGHWQPRL
jgi:hypothetical protein